MSEKVFKKGDRVKCVDSGATGLLDGGFYTVRSWHPCPYYECGSGITLEAVAQIEHFYLVTRFELVDSAEVTRVAKTRAEEIAELETKLAALKAEEAADRTKAAVEERRKYIDTLCEQIKAKIDQTNYQACWYRLIVDGRGIDLTIGSRSSEE